MNKEQRIEYLKQKIDEMRQQNDYPNVPNLFAEDLAKELAEWEAE